MESETDHGRCRPWALLPPMARRRPFQGSWHRPHIYSACYESSGGGRFFGTGVRKQLIKSLCLSSSCQISMGGTALGLTLIGFGLGAVSRDLRLRMRRDTFDLSLRFLAHLKRQIPREFSPVACLGGLKGQSHAVFNLGYFSLNYRR